MTTVILVIHLLLAISLVGVILLQRSEGGGLGIGGGSGMSGFMTGRATANFLSRTTAVLAVAFMATSLGLALIANSQRAPTSILDQTKPTAPAQAPAPTKPATPEVPLAK